MSKTIDFGFKRSRVQGLCCLRITNYTGMRWVSQNIFPCEKFTPTYIMRNQTRTWNSIYVTLSTTETARLCISLRPRASASPQSARSFQLKLMCSVLSRHLWGNLGDCSPKCLVLPQRPFLFPAWPAVKTITFNFWLWI